MKIYVYLDEKNRLQYYDTAPGEGSIEVELDENHPIISKGRVNYRYDGGEWVEDNSVYEEWLAQQEQEQQRPEEEHIGQEDILEALLDLDFRFTMLEMGKTGGEEA